MAAGTVPLRWGSRAAGATPPLLLPRGFPKGFPSGEAGWPQARLMRSYNAMPRAFIATEAQGGSPGDLFRHLLRKCHLPQRGRLLDAIYGVPTVEIEPPSVF